MSKAKSGSGCLIFILGIVCAVLYMKWNPSANSGNADGSSYSGADSGYGQEKTSLLSKTASILGLSSGQSTKASLPDRVYSDAERLQLASAWQTGGKGQSVARLNAMKTAFDSKTSCPAYHYAKTLAQEARSAIIKFEQAIGYDDYINAAKYDAEATEAMRRFELNCRWRAGVSKGYGTHMHSGQVEGTWVLDGGYVNIGGRVAKEIECNKCKGGGSVTEYEDCARCNGRGQVDNPAAHVKDAIDWGNELSGLLGKSRVPRINTPRVPRTIPCGNCNGRGRMRVTRPCGRCNGQGRIYE